MMVETRKLDVFLCFVLSVDFLSTACISQAFLNKISFLIKKKKKKISFWFNLSASVVDPIMNLCRMLITSIFFCPSKCNFSHAGWLT
jgi:hypothetical protein